MWSSQRRNIIDDHPSTAGDDGREELNRSAVRAGALLVALGRHPGGASAAQLAAETGIPRPTVFRLLLSLAYNGLVAREDGTFSLGWRTAQLGRVADPHRGILPRIQLILDGLATELNESVEYTVFNGPGSQETVAQSTSGRLLAPTQQYVGHRFPLHASATGKLLLSSLSDREVEALVPEELEAFTESTIVDRTALLAELAVVRGRGFVTLDNELEEGLFVVAVPVHGSGGELIGGLASSGIDTRMKAVGVQVYAAELQAAATDIAEVVADGAVSDPG